MGGRRRHEMGLAPSAIRALERLRQCSIFAMTQHRIVLSRWGTLNQAFCTSSGLQIWARAMPDQPITEAHADSRPGRGAGGPVVHMARCLRQRTGPAQDVLCGGVDLHITQTPPLEQAGFDEFTSCRPHTMADLDLVPCRHYRVIPAPRVRSACAGDWARVRHASARAALDKAGMVPSPR